MRVYYHEDRIDIVTPNSTEENVFLFLAHAANGNGKTYVLILYFNSVHVHVAFLSF